MKQLAINFETEIWKSIKEYKDCYQISNLGNVFKLKSKELSKLRINDWGYLTVTLCNNGFTKTYRVHRLVAMTFIPNPENKPFVNHINGIKTDNKLSNLEWVTASENQIHAFKTGLKKPSLKRRLEMLGENHHLAKLKKTDIPDIRRLRKGGMQYKEIAKLYNVGKSTIQNIIYKNTWGHVN